MPFSLSKFTTGVKDSLLDKLKKIKGTIGAKTKTDAAIDWFKTNINKLLGKNPVVSRHQLIRTQNATKLSSVQIGNMYQFVYDAKWKNELPYWDKFPLSIVIEMYPDGFLGLNLHYLPPQVRAVLLDELMQYKTTKDISEKTRLQLSWRMLADSRKHPMIYPCVKRYLYSHVQSNFLMVNPTEWEHVIFLPIENFQKQTKEYVWKQSGF